MIGNTQFMKHIAQQCQYTYHQCSNFLQASSGLGLTHNIDYKKYGFTLALKSRELYHTRLNNINSVSPISQPLPTAMKSQPDTFEQLQNHLGVKFQQGSLISGLQSLIFVLSGPSGVGKDSIHQLVRQKRPDIHRVVTAASRNKRPGEVDGVDYLFVSKQEFERMISNKELVEYAQVYGEYKGVPRKQLDEPLKQGKDVMLQVDVQGAATLRQLYKDRVVSIFVMAESEAALVRRLINRQTEEFDRLATRVATARQEYLQMNKYDYVVVNKEGKLQEAAQQVLDIMEVEKLKTSRTEVNLG